MKLNFLSAWLFFLLVSCSQHHYSKVSSPALLFTFSSLEEKPVNKTDKTAIGVNEGWSIYKDIIFSGTNIEGTLLTTEDLLTKDTFLNCRITEGDSYNNLFFTYTLAKKAAIEKWHFTEINQFVYSLDFLLDTYHDCTYHDNSELEGLEFTFQIATPPHSFLWGIQWSKSNVWSYWDNTKINGKTKAWIKMPGLHDCILKTQWNTIYITGHRDQKGLYYDSLCLNNSLLLLNKFVPITLLPPGWVENYLQVGFQINGNKAVRKNHSNGLDPVSVYLNNIHLLLRKVSN